MLASSVCGSTLALAAPQGLHDNVVIRAGHTAPSTPTNKQIKLLKAKAPAAKPVKLTHPCARMSVSTLNKRAKPYQDAITKYAKRYKVAESMIKAVIAIESCYNDQAVSPKGAQGLMQLIPGTADRFGVSDAFDAAQNIRGGTRYLRWLSERYKADMTKILAAYNAGEGKVDRYGGIPPYQETQHYVRNVLAVHEKLSNDINTTPPVASKAAPLVMHNVVARLSSQAGAYQHSPRTSQAAVKQAQANARQRPQMRHAVQRQQTATPPPQVVTVSERRPVVGFNEAALSPAPRQQTAKRVRNVYQAAVPTEPFKPGRAGWQANKAIAPQLYKR